MRQDIWVRHSDVEDAGASMVEVLQAGKTSITLGAYAHGVTLYLDHNDALTLAQRILDAQRESYSPVIVETVEEVTEVETTSTSTALVCDHCGKPAHVFGVSYVHTLRGDTAAGGFFACARVDSTQPEGQFCAVNGRDQLSEDEIAALNVIEVL